LPRNAQARAINCDEEEERNARPASPSAAAGTSRSRAGCHRRLPHSTARPCACPDFCGRPCRWAARPPRWAPPLPRRPPVPAWWLARLVVPSPCLQALDDWHSPRRAAARSVHPEGEACGVPSVPTWLATRCLC